MTNYCTDNCPSEDCKLNCKCFLPNENCITFTESINGIQFRAIGNNIIFQILKKEKTILTTNENTGVALKDVRCKVLSIGDGIINNILLCKLEFIPVSVGDYIIPSPNMIMPIYEDPKGNIFSIDIKYIVGVVKFDK